MKAMVLDKPGPIEHNRLRLAELPRPVPEENEILIKVSFCGLCHTALDEIEGRLPPTKWPIVLGHQIVGTVADKGSSAGRFGIEQRVGITWSNPVGANGSSARPAANNSSATPNP